MSVIPQPILPKNAEQALTQALATVGTRPEDRARWLFAFGARELDRMPAALEQTRREISAFIDLGLDSPQRPIPLNDVVFGASSVPQIHEAWKTALNALRESGNASAPRSTRSHLRWQRATGEAWIGAAGTDALAAFFAIAFQLLTRTGFRSCARAKCDAFFVPSRSDQLYCSKSCRDAEAQTRFRKSGEPEERSEKDHEKYARRVQRGRKKRGLMRANVTRRGRRIAPQMLGRKEGR
jgi:hypothetical protein